MTSEPYKLLIIGCGNIAGGYDLLQPEEALPLSHAKAFLKHGGFKLTACIDPDVKKLEAFKEHWNIQEGYSSADALSGQAQKFDVISICSPTSEHANDLQIALNLSPKLIFCEKPITNNFNETTRLVSVCEEKQIMLAVNYSRRWAPEFAEIKTQLSNQYWGAVRSVNAVYNKGILNNGSHMLDLLDYFFGPLTLKTTGQFVQDYFKDDPTIEATFVTEQGIPIHLNIAHAKDYALFEMQIVTENGLINMEHGGARWRFRGVEQSEKLVGYKFLNSGQWLESNESFAMANAVANIFEALENGTPLASTGKNALVAQSLCEQIKNLVFLPTQIQASKKDAL